MRMTAATLLVLGASVCAAPAQIALQKNCEVVIDTDKTEGNMKDKEVSFIGNVIVTNCDNKLRADRMRVTTLDGKANRIVATGRVVMDSPRAGIATADNGVFDVPRNIVTLTGRVILKKDKIVMEGTPMTVNLNTGIATLGGAGTAVAASPGTPAQPPGRVRAVFGAPTQGGK
jgi:lipopolysaccharide transport protein LptA